MPYMPIFRDDWIGGTIHLTPGAEGVYLRLCLHQWEYGSLPGDAPALRRVARVEADEWSQIWPEIRGKFRSRDGKTIHPKVEKVYQETMTRATRNRENGSKGGRPRKPKPEPTEKPKPEPKPEPRENHTHTQSHTTEGHSQSQTPPPPGGGGGLPGGSKEDNEFLEELREFGCPLRPEDFILARDKAKRADVWTKETRDGWIRELANMTETLGSPWRWFESRVDIAIDKASGKYAGGSKQQGPRKTWQIKKAIDALADQKRRMWGRYAFDTSHGKKDHPDKWKECQALTAKIASLEEEYANADD